MHAQSALRRVRGRPRCDRAELACPMPTVVHVKMEAARGLWQQWLTRVRRTDRRGYHMTDP